MTTIIPRPPKERWIKIQYASILSMVTTQDIKNWVDKRNVLADWNVTQVNGMNKWLFSFDDISRLSIINVMRNRLGGNSLEVCAVAADKCLERFYDLYSPKTGYPVHEEYTSKLLFSLNDDGSLSSLLLRHEDAQDFWGGIMALKNETKLHDVISEYIDAGDPEPIAHLKASFRDDLPFQGINRLDEQCFFVFSIDAFFASSWSHYLRMQTALEHSVHDSTPMRGFRGIGKKPR